MKRNLSTNPKMIMFDACYNGSFHENDYIAGQYIFNDGQTLVAQGNTRWSHFPFCSYRSQYFKYRYNNTQRWQSLLEEFVKQPIRWCTKFGHAYAGWRRYPKGIISVAPEEVPGKWLQYGSYGSYQVVEPLSGRQLHRSITRRFERYLWNGSSPKCHLCWICRWRFLIARYCGSIGRT